MDARKKARRKVANCAVKDPYRSMSRNAMACWFIPHTGTSHNLTELSTGVIYSRLLAQLFPDCLNTRKLKTGLKLTDRDKLHNWKVFQLGLMNLKLNKEVDIEQMIKPTSVCSFEFCRWFIAFHSHHSPADGLVRQAMWKLPTSRLRMPPTPPRLQPTPRARTVSDLETLTEDEEDATQKNVACSPIRILWEEEEEQRPLAQRASVRFQVPDQTVSVSSLAHRVERPAIFPLPDVDIFQTDEQNEDTDSLPALSPILANEENENEEEEGLIPEEDEDEIFLSAEKTQVETDEEEEIRPADADAVPRTPRTPRWKPEFQWDMVLRSSSKKMAKKEGDKEEPQT